MAHTRSEQASPSPKRITLAAHSFINETLLPRLVADSARPIRALSVPHSFMAQYAAAGILDVAVTIGTKLRLPASWSSVEVGELAYGLFASPRIARELDAVVHIDDLRTRPFVAPIYQSREVELVPGDDRCPLPRHERLVGHEVETMALACLVAAETDHLVYGPKLAAAPLVATAMLVELNVPEWAHGDPLYLACNDAVIDAKDRSWLAAAIRSTFSAVNVYASGVVPVGDTVADKRAAGRSRRR